MSWRLFPAFHNCEGKGGCIGEDLCWSCCTSVKKTFSHSMQAKPMRITRCWSIHWMGLSFCGDQHGLLAVILKWANCKLCYRSILGSMLMHVAVDISTGHCHKYKHSWSSCLWRKLLLKLTCKRCLLAQKLVVYGVSVFLLKSGIASALTTAVA
jgi:hypothetical protein